MKKLLFTFLGLILATNLIFAGGLVTNTNQSASWTRMLVRDASTSIDAAYFNPAGLTKLTDGLHVYVSNQSIFQNRSIENSLFTGKTWEGEVVAPLFPNVYVAYKTGKFAFSLGFMPIGGGGSANYTEGIPMVELGLRSLYALPNVTGYTVDASLEGSSMYLGIQGGISYEINDMISVYAGARYIMANNKYVGQVSNISVITPTATVRADTYMDGIALQLNTGATQLHGYADNVASFAGGYGSATTFNQAITAATNAGQTAHVQQLTGLRNGLTGLGVPNAGALSLAAGEITYDTYGNGYSAQAAEVSAGADLMADQEVDVVQKGHGFTPIVGLNLSLMDDKLNLGVKYEFKTNMDVTNETPEGKGFVIGMDPETGDPIEMYPDGAITNADIPAMLSVGLGYKFSDKFNAQIGYHTYFDNASGWSDKVIKEDNVPIDTVSVIDKNFWEAGIGFEYIVNDKLLFSCGYLMALTGVNDYYHTDLSYSLNSNTIGLGGAYKINDMIGIELGIFNTWYKSATVLDPVTTSYTQTYSKSNLGFGIGLNFNLGGK